MKIDITIGQLLTILASLIPLISAAYAYSVKMAKLEMKVDTTWKFLMRRAEAEALMKGAATLENEDE